MTSKVFEFSEKDPFEPWTFGFIDGEYILRRNFNMIAEQDQENLIDIKELYRSFINSVMKFKREQNVKFIIIAFDKSKYYTSCSIEQYKQDRYNASEEAESLEEQLQNPNLTEEERAELERQLKKAKHDTDNFWEYQKVKKDLLENPRWARAGFHTVYKRGYEADMIIYYLACKIEEVHKRDNKITALIYSGDKDQVNFQKEGCVEFLSAWNNKNKYEKLENEYIEAYNDYNEKYPDAEVKLDMYSYGILNELGGSTHNNASVVQPDDTYWNTMDWSEYYYRILNQKPIEEFKSYSIMRKCYEALHLYLGKTCDNGYCPESEQGILYYKDLEPTINNILKQCNKYESGVLADLIEDLGIYVNIANYSVYTKYLTNMINL